MAINVNTVYTTVLSILNKEQRGYITPYEFNKLAAQAQLELFEKFFQDYNQYLRMPKIDAEFGSRVEHLENEIQIFEEYKSASSSTDGIYKFPTEPEVYRLGSVYYNAVNGAPQVELVNRKEYKEQLMSPLTQPSVNFPIGILRNNSVEIFPKVTTFNPAGSYANTDVKYSYIRKPKNPRWGYVVGSLGQFTYDPTVFNPDLLVDGISLFTNITTNPTDKNPETTENVEQDDTLSTTSGTGLKVTIVTAGTAGSATVTEVTITEPGSGYLAGDIIGFAGDEFGGLVGGNLILTLAPSNFMGGTTFGSTNFEIDETQQTELILEILKYTGVIIRDPQIIQAAQQELVQDEANSKR